MVFFLKLAIVLMAFVLFFKIEGTNPTRWLNGETAKVALIIGVVAIIAMKFVELF